MKPQTNLRNPSVEPVRLPLATASVEFHIYASKEESFFELSVPDDDCRIQFCSLFAAAQYARKHQGGRNAMIVIHDLSSKRLNRIPLPAGIELLRS